MIRDRVTAFPCLRDGCAGTAENGRVFCLMCGAIVDVERAVRVPS